MGLITDPDTGLDVLIKQPRESRLFDLPFSSVMRSGDTISSIESGFPLVTNMGKVAGSSNVVVASSTHNGSIVQIRLEGGQDKENYKITCLVTTTQGDKVEADGMLYVRDL